MTYMYITIAAGQYLAMCVTVLQNTLPEPTVADPHTATYMIERFDHTSGVFICGLIVTFQAIRQLSKHIFDVVFINCMHETHGDANSSPSVKAETYSFLKLGTVNPD
jgi:hypothetical protein